MKIGIATSSFGFLSDKPIKLLKSSGFKIKENHFNRKLNDSELINFGKDLLGIIAGTENYNANVLKNLPKLKAVSRLGVGIDNIDLNLAKKYGIEVLKTITSPGPAVAELVLGLMLNIARNINLHHQDLINNKWNKRMGTLLRGKTLGIVGLGSIGKDLVELVSGFKFKIIVNDLFQDNVFAKKYNINYCSLDTIFRESDIISIHVNLNDKTKNLVNDKFLKLLKPEAILINASRGGIVDEEGLYNSLKSKSIMGVGLDVYKKEPYFGKLKKLENTILTPHIGSYASEIRIKMEIEAAENLIKGLKGT
tara:strand:- start:8437 stop:9360 length:924 start_codon:yes stop_codon:yes gene_type:complete